MPTTAQLEYIAYGKVPTGNAPPSITGGVVSPSVVAPPPVGWQNAPPQPVPLGAAPVESAPSLEPGAAPPALIVVPEPNVDLNVAPDRPGGQAVTIDGQEYYIEGSTMYKMGFRTPEEYSLAQAKGVPYGPHSGVLAEASPSAIVEVKNPRTGEMEHARYPLSGALMNDPEYQASLRGLQYSGTDQEFLDKQRDLQNQKITIPEFNEWLQEKVNLGTSTKFLIPVGDRLLTQNQYNTMVGISDPQTQFEYAQELGIYPQDSELVNRGGKDYIITAAESVQLAESSEAQKIIRDLKAAGVLTSNPDGSYSIDAQGARDKGFSDEDLGKIGVSQTDILKSYGADVPDSIKGALASGNLTITPDLFTSYLSQAQANKATRVSALNVLSPYIGPTPDAQESGKHWLNGVLYTRNESGVWTKAGKQETSPYTQLDVSGAAAANIPFLTIKTAGFTGISEADYGKLLPSFTPSITGAVQYDQPAVPEGYDYSKVDWSGPKIPEPYTQAWYDYYGKTAPSIGAYVESDVSVWDKFKSFFTGEPLPGQRLAPGARDLQGGGVSKWSIPGFFGGLSASESEKKAMYQMMAKTGHEAFKVPDTFFLPRSIQIGSNIPLVGSFIPLQYQWEGMTPEQRSSALVSAFTSFGVQAMAFGAAGLAGAGKVRIGYQKGDIYPWRSEVFTAERRPTWAVGQEPTLAKGSYPVPEVTQIKPQFKGSFAESIYSRSPVSGQLVRTGETIYNRGFVNAPETLVDMAHKNWLYNVGRQEFLTNQWALEMARANEGVWNPSSGIYTAVKPQLLLPRTTQTAAIEPTMTVEQFNKKYGLSNEPYKPAGRTPEGPATSTDIRNMVNELKVAEDMLAKGSRKSGPIQDMVDNTKRQLRERELQTKTAVETKTETAVQMEQRWKILEGKDVPAVRTSTEITTRPSPVRVSQPRIAPLETPAYVPKWTPSPRVGAPIPSFIPIQIIKPGVMVKGYVSATAQTLEEQLAELERLPLTEIERQARQRAIMATATYTSPEVGAWNRSATLLETATGTKIYAVSGLQFATMLSTLTQPLTATLAQTQVQPVMVTTTPIKTIITTKTTPIQTIPTPPPPPPPPPPKTTGIFGLIPDFGAPSLSGVTVGKGKGKPKRGLRWLQEAMILNIQNPLTGETYKSQIAPKRARKYGATESITKVSGVKL